MIVPSWMSPLQYVPYYLLLGPSRHSPRSYCHSTQRFQFSVDVGYADSTSEERLFCDLSLYPSCFGLVGHPEC